ncbi:MAG TPA: alpha/beta hydrolase [Parvibaculum sp.]
MNFPAASAPFVLVPGNPMPEGGTARWLTASDGVRLRAMVWPKAEAKGTVFLFGGRTEFAEKYFEVVGELLGRGFAVATVDWRGQGLSDRALADPRKGHIDDFASFGRDIEVVMGDVAPGMPKPWIALAHSMGGNILLRAAHDHPAWFSAVVLSAPMLGLRFGSPGARRAAAAVAACCSLAGLGGRYLPGGTPKAADEVPFDENILTHDAGRYAIYQALVRAEPKLGLGASTLGWLAAAFRSMTLTAAPGYLARIATPVLIAVAGQDGLIDRASLAAAAEGLPQGELVTVENSRHEILMERDECRRVFWAAFDDFIARKVFSG